MTRFGRLCRPCRSGGYPCAVAEHGRDDDWRPRDPAKLDDVRQGLSDLNEGDDVERLSDAIAAALRAAQGSRFDQEKLWERVERSLDERTEPGDDGGQSGEESTPGR